MRASFVARETSRRNLNSRFACLAVLFIAGHFAESSRALSHGIGMRDAGERDVSSVWQRLIVRLQVQVNAAAAAAAIFSLRKRLIPLDRYAFYFSRAASLLLLDATLGCAEKQIARIIGRIRARARYAPLTNAAIKFVFPPFSRRRRFLKSPRSPSLRTFVPSLPLHSRGGAFLSFSSRSRRALVSPLAPLASLRPPEQSMERTNWSFSDRLASLFRALPSPSRLVVSSGLMKINRDRSREQFRARAIDPADDELRERAEIQHRKDR